MPLDRTPVPRSKEPLNAYLERTLQSLDDWASQVEARVNELVRLRAISGLEIRYKWDDTIVIATPVGAGEIKADNANMNLVTQFALSRIDDFGRLALTPTILDYTIPGFFEVNDLTRDNVYEYEIDSQTQRDTDVVLDVTFIEETAGAPPQAGDLVQAQVWPDIITEPL